MPANTNDIRNDAVIDDKGKAQPKDREDMEPAPVDANLNQPAPNLYADSGEAVENRPGTSTPTVADDSVGLATNTTPKTTLKPTVSSNGTPVGHPID